jgi:hypothetical protein
VSGVKVPPVGYQGNLDGGWEEEPRWVARVTRYEEVINYLDEKPPGRRIITSGEAGTLIHRSIFGRCPDDALTRRPHGSKDCCNRANTFGGDVLDAMVAKGLMRKIRLATYELVEP